MPFEVASLVDDLRRERGVLDNVTVYLTVPVPFPFAGPPAAVVFKQLLKDQNIIFLNNHEVTKVTNGTTVHFQNGTEIKADLLLTTYPQRAPDFCKPLCNQGGYMPVDLQTNKVSSVEKGNVYAIGDACHAMFPKPNKPHPKAGEFAYLMGLHVADQIVASLTPGTEVAPPLRKASCVAECGVGGNGVNIQPNFSEILASPADGMPIFEFPIVPKAANEKTTWVNGYLAKFFGPDKASFNR